MTAPHRVLLCILALAFTGVLAAPLAGADTGLQKLLKEWEIVQRRTDERGWAEQRRVLDAIADVNDTQSRRALRKMRDKYGRGDWRRTSLILAAMVRHAEPDQLDDVIRWVEVRRNPYLLENLAEVLVHVGDPLTRAHLRGDALKRATPVVKAQIARSLGLAGFKKAVPALLLLLREKFVRVRVEALDALALLEDDQAVAPIVVFLHAEDARVRAAAARALGNLGDVRCLESLVESLKDKCPLVVESAALSLGRLRDPKAIPDLLDALERVLTCDLRRADAVARALEEISGKPIGVDIERWRDWWKAVEARPWKRADDTDHPAEGRTVPATYYGFPVNSSRLVFVLDVSRSMSWGDRLPYAKRELGKVLKSLPEKTHFNIVIFSDGANVWQSKGRPASSRYLQKALKYISKQKPQNGTNAWSALQLAMKDQEVDTIYFLSDGHPSVGAITDPDLILAELRTVNRYRRVRIHCVALVKGEAPTGFGAQEDTRRAESFMRRLAADHDGNFKIVK